MSRGLVAAHTAAVLVADVHIAVAVIAAVVGSLPALIVAVLLVAALRSAAYAIRLRVQGHGSHTSREHHPSRSRT